MERGFEFDKSGAIAAAAAQRASVRVGIERKAGAAIGVDADYIIREVQQQMIDMGAAKGESDR